MTSRRAFLIGSGAFTLGTAIGGPCGYLIAVGSPPPAAPEDVPEPTGDEDLDELRRLAVKAPIDELLDRRLVFVECIISEYPDDRCLWRGVSRLCDAVLGNAVIEDPRLFATWVAELIEGSRSTHAAALKNLVPRLKSIR